MEYYIARDENGFLALYEGLPERSKNFSFWVGYSIEIDSGLFPEITWESEPVKVNLKLEKI